MYLLDVRVSEDLEDIGVLLDLVKLLKLLLFLIVVETSDKGYNSYSTQNADAFKPKVSMLIGEKVFDYN
jgi:hypothetical protein